jgi:hypothetical protein
MHNAHLRAVLEIKNSFIQQYIIMEAPMLKLDCSVGAPATGKNNKIVVDTSRREAKVDNSDESCASSCWSYRHAAVF